MEFLVNNQLGRLRITSNYEFTGNLDEDIETAKKIIKETISLHQTNIPYMQRLINYYYNNTNIQNKTKTLQPDINNKVTIGYPSIASITKNSYTLSNPPKFVSRNTDKQEMVKSLNDCFDDDNYHSKTMKMAFYSSMTGLGYKYIRPANEEEHSNGKFFVTKGDISPLNTYCVYTNDINQEKICAIQFYDKSILNKNYNKTKKFYYVWTKYHYFEFVADYKDKSGYSLASEPYALLYNRIPIVENERTQDRLGDYELALDLIDGINALASSRIDNVEQNTDNIILLRDIDVESDGAIEKILLYVRQGLIAFKSIPTTDLNVPQPDIDVLNTPLNQAEVQTLQDFLSNKLEEVLHIPNRDTRGGGGGDTGSAVESRNGFRSLENIAGLITTSLLESENETLDVILAISKNYTDCPFKDLKPKDIEIKPMRNKVENLSTATTAFATMINAGVNRVTAYVVSGLVADANDTARMDELERDNKFQEQIRQEQIRLKMQKENSDNKTDTNAE